MRPVSGFPSTLSKNWCVNPLQRLTPTAPPIGFGKGDGLLLSTVQPFRCRIRMTIKEFIHNQKLQGIGLGFPLARIVALISLSSRVVRDLANWPYKGKNTGETALLRNLEWNQRSYGSGRRKTRCHSGELSFKGALQTMTAFQDIARHASPHTGDRLISDMFNAISRRRVGHRFGRVEPSANKRRPKPQRYLNEPRSEARKRLLQKT